jgi:uncharacterized coiled-coil DUF342 family protein
MEQIMQTSEINNEVNVLIKELEQNYKDANSSRSQTDKIEELEQENFQLKEALKDGRAMFLNQKQHADTLREDLEKSIKNFDELKEINGLYKKACDEYEKRVKLLETFKELYEKRIDAMTAQLFSLGVNAIHYKATVPNLKGGC